MNIPYETPEARNVRTPRMRPWSDIKRGSLPFSECWTPAHVPPEPEGPKFGLIALLAPMVNKRVSELHRAGAADIQVRREGSGSMTFIDYRAHEEVPR